MATAAATMESTIKEGWLSKKGGYRYKKRFCVLTSRALRYYSDESCDEDKRKGIIYLVDVTDISNAGGHGIEISTDSGSEMFKADTALACADWLETIKAIASRVTTIEDAQVTSRVERGEYPSLLLKILSPEELAGRIFEIGSDGATLGSHRNNSIKVQDSAGSVSRSHARIILSTKELVYYIEDTGSSNGTALIHKDAVTKLNPSTPTPLESGVTIRLGQDVRILCTFEGVEGANAAPPTGPSTGASGYVAPPMQPHPQQVAGAGMGMMMMGGPGLGMNNAMMGGPMMAGGGGNMYGGPGAGGVMMPGHSGMYMGGGGGMAPMMNPMMMMSGSTVPMQQQSSMYQSNSGTVYGSTGMDETGATFASVSTVAADADAVFLDSWTEGGTHSHTPDEGFHGGVNPGGMQANARISAVVGAGNTFDGRSVTPRVQVDHLTAFDSVASTASSDGQPPPVPVRRTAPPRVPPRSRGGGGGGGKNINNVKAGIRSPDFESVGRRPGSARLAAINARRASGGQGDLPTPDADLMSIPPPPPDESLMSIPPPPPPESVRTGPGGIPFVPMDRNGGAGPESNNVGGGPGGGSSPRAGGSGGSPRRPATPPSSSSAVGGKFKVKAYFVNDDGDKEVARVSLIPRPPGTPNKAVLAYILGELKKTFQLSTLRPDAVRITFEDNDGDEFVLNTPQPPPDLGEDFFTYASKVHIRTI